eukprot:2636677-Amphidinium_carterae.1
MLQKHTIRVNTQFWEPVLDLPLYASPVAFLSVAEVVAISMGTRAQLLCVASLLGNAFACG